MVPVLQGPLKSKRWIVGSSNHGCWLGSYEFAKQAAIARAVQSGWVVYDVGAHVGFYTLLASALAGPAGHVYAFEPLPRNCRLLRRHLTLNCLTNVTLMEAALTATDGESCFDEGENHLMGRLAPSGSLLVRTVSLDSFLRAGEVRPPNLIKIDVEGAEADVLTGAHDTLRSCRPVIFLATHGRQADERCRQILKDQCYSVEILNGCSPDELIARPRCRTTT